MIDTEFLYPNCKEEHLMFASSLIDLDTLKVYCEFCCRNVNPMKLNLKLGTARLTLNEIVESKLKTAQAMKCVKNYLALRKLKKKIYDKLEHLSQIYKQLKLFFRLESDSPLCSKHLNKGVYVNQANLKFKCTECDNWRICQVCNKSEDLNESVSTDKSLKCDHSHWLHFESQKKYIIERALDICKACKTAVFTRSVLAFVKKRQTDDISCKNFIIEVSIMLKTKNSSMNNKSFCLSCGTRFVLGNRAPILLHDHPLHEICYKCFSNKIRKCPIDGMDLPAKLQALSSDTLYTLPKFKCHFSYTDECESSFSQHNRNHAFETECGHNACKACWDKTQAEFSCPKCGYMQTKLDRQNLYVRRKLKYLEVLCEEHNAPSEFFNPELRTVTCSECSTENDKIIRPLEVIQSLSLGILDDLLEVPTRQILRNSINHYAKIALFRPLQSTYNIYHNIKYLVDQRIAYMRFDSILPYAEDSALLWYQLQPEKIVFEIRCTTSIDVMGMIFGRPFDSRKDVSVYTDTGELLFQGRIGRVRNLANNKFKRVRFQRALFVKKTCRFSIYYDFGKYVHGKFDAAITPLLKIEKTLTINNETFEISVKQIESQAQKIGHQTFGGPLLGLELGNRQSYSTNMPSMEICFEV